jgi:hypothetical protein
MDHPKTKASIAIFFVAVLIGAWWGIPTYFKAKADAYVDELCAKDGGIRIFQKVKLPAERFDESGQVRVPSASYRKPGDLFYYTTSTARLRGGTNSANDLVIWRDVHELYRAEDGTKLAEAVVYVRRGGDALSWAHPSSHVCPQRTGLSSAAFIKD